MEYLSDIREFKLLRNYINNDPVCDYFQLQTHLNNNMNFEKDTNNYFNKYVNKVSSDFIDDFFNNIINKSIIYYPEITFTKFNNINQTIQKIYDNIPLIINPILMNDKYKLIVKCDIMIKKKLFIKIFNQINNISFNSIKNEEYLIINIVPEILTFKSGLREISNTYNVFYNKCGLYAFNSALRKYINRNNYYFLFGKDYKYNNQLLNKRQCIGLVIFDNIYREKIHNSLNWLDRLKENKLILFPKPSSIELYPNMNNKQSCWENEKKKLSKELKEITLIWRISYEDRNRLISMGITEWDNPYLLNNLYELKDTNTRDIQERIIHMNKYNNLIIEPRNISRDFKDILKVDDNEFILDIESVLNLETKGSYFNNDIQKDLPNICIIGLIIINNGNFVFKDFTIDDLTIESEKRNINNWLNFISKYDEIKIYHWGHAEKTYLENIHKRFPDIKLPRMKLIDLLHFFRQEPIIIKDCFNFSLKTIGKNMYKHKLINSTWSETDNGLDAMIKFKEICLKKDKNIPLKRYNEISEIIEYNKMDCVILKEILEYLRYKYL
tara:strand:- start:55 stop:1716 length:1662 start_codon:yes stop_codon:yes gene_type:complete